jgi:hypothetical protein
MEPSSLDELHISLSEGVRSRLDLPIPFDGGPVGAVENENWCNRKGNVATDLPKADLQRQILPRLHVETAPLVSRSPLSTIEEKAGGRIGKRT